jgi:hypothetical protein
MKKPLPKRKPKQEKEKLETLKLKADLKYAVENFLKYPEMKRLNRGLRKMLILYLTYENAGLPLDFEDFMIDLYFLHNFLDVVEDRSGGMI